MKKIASLVMCLFLLLGCGHFASEQKSDVWEEKIEQSPWLITADYFRYKAQKEAHKTSYHSQNTSKFLPKNKANYFLKRKVLVACLLSAAQCEQLGDLGNMLEHTGKVLTVGYNEIHPVFQRLSLRKSDLKEVKDRKRIADLLGLQAIIIIDHGPKNGQFSFDICGQNGLILKTLVVDHVDNNLARQIADFVATHSIWEGRVAYVEGNKVYLNVGQLSGLKIGQLLGVYAPGKEVVNPVTGVSLGHLSQKKGVIRIKGFFGNNAAIAEVVSGGNFKVNDIVKIEVKQ